ncbi:MAG: HEPN domain-containing protein [Nitrososphaerota archaeon]
MVVCFLLLWDELIQLGLELDKHYILSMYPNAWPHGSPSKIYRVEDAEKALGSARRILEYVEGEVEAYLR